MFCVTGQCILVTVAQEESLAVFTVSGTFVGAGSIMWGWDCSGTVGQTASNALSFATSSLSLWFSSWRASKASSLCSCLWFLASSSSNFLEQCDCCQKFFLAGHWGCLVVLMQKLLESAETWQRYATALSSMVISSDNI
ncbi:hypothetical protein BDF14DRAFT_955687 [Spinellus fusiger]|nr:hypothetical protein BDF14DRAFT_955687 [Spinellus fusiger]